jgi:hypothetical protein
MSNQAWETERKNTWDMPPRENPSRRFWLSPCETTCASGPKESMIIQNIIVVPAREDKVWTYILLQVLQTLLVYPSQQALDQYSETLRTQQMKICRIATKRGLQDRVHGRQNNTILHKLLTYENTTESSWMCLSHWSLLCQQPCNRGLCSQVIKASKTKARAKPSMLLWCLVVG